MVTWKQFLVIAKIVIGLLPTIITLIREEEQRQAGRDEIVTAVLGRLKNASQTAKDARDAASDRIDREGVRSDDTFRRD